jgi:hypothetical protein
MSTTFESDPYSGPAYEATALFSDIPPPSYAAIASKNKANHPSQRKRVESNRSSSHNYDHHSSSPAPRDRHAGGHHSPGQRHMASPRSQRSQQPDPALTESNWLKRPSSISTDTWKSLAHFRIETVCSHPSIPFAKCPIFVS